jgi:hypothetical protein
MLHKRGTFALAYNVCWLPVFAVVYSKEISKSNVVDDMVASNSLLYEPGEHPDHTVVIKYGTAGCSSHHGALLGCTWPLLTLCLPAPGIAWQKVFGNI